MAPLSLIVSILQLTLVLGNKILPVRQLQPVPQLQKRNPYYGGYALAEAPKACPAGLEACSLGSCCPMGTFCGNDAAGQPICCPTADDCGTQVTDLPTCGDPTWSLYVWDGFVYFCCTSDEVGINPGQCQPKSLTFPVTEYASTATQANTAVPPATRSGGPTQATAAGTGQSVGTPTGSSGSTPTATAGHNDGNRLDGSDRAILGGLIGLAAIGVPAMV